MQKYNSVYKRKRILRGHYHFEVRNTIKFFHTNAYSEAEKTIQALNYLKSQQKLYSAKISTSNIQFF